MTSKHRENAMAENYFGLTDTGRVRGNNEDAFIAQQNQAGYILAGVIDGVGGYQGGEVAAAIARDELTSQLDTVQADITPAIVQAFKAANRAIYARKQQEKELESMACVLTMAVVDAQNNQLYYAHVGDTRLYLLRDGSLIKLTKDQSFVGFLEDSGRITESAAMSHPKRNEINKALGFNNTIDTDENYIETGDSPFLPGDMLLLCSDGLTDLVDKSTITAIITADGGLENKAKQLIEAANQKGGKDNITVVLVQHTKGTVRTATTAPASAVKKNDNTVEAFKQTARPQPVPASAPVGTVPATVKKGGNGTSIILGILCLLLLGSTVWLYTQLQKKSPETASLTDTKTNPSVARNADELKLQQAIDRATGDTLLLSDSVFKQPILITDTLRIEQDTLFIKAQGNIVLKADTGYRGVAMLVTNAEKVVLSGLKLEGFQTAIQVNNGGVQLQSVQFNNCLQAVQNIYVVNDNQQINSMLPYLKLSSDTSQRSTVQPNGTR
jgi:PPM family protein phosphatase